MALTIGIYVYVHYVQLLVQNHLFVLCFRHARICVYICVCLYLFCHVLQLDEAPPESGGVGMEVGEPGDHKATTTSGYSNIEAIEMTAAGMYVPLSYYVSVCTLMFRYRGRSPFPFHNVRIWF